MTDRRPFWEKVQRGADNECWPWTGYKLKSGHGITTFKYMKVLASKKAWSLTHGRVPDGQCVLHRCDNAACCNPKHMYLGTRADNMLDRWGKIPAHERRQYNRRIVLTDAQLLQLAKMRNGGALLRECAAEFKVHIATIVRYITEARRRKLVVRRSRRQAGPVSQTDIST